ncbi:putative malate dehydrogenase 1B isoform X2 [Ischnura elegans]|uniref:putative malate dehydrogenase 1B isoform X2 n=1 Tax=Ischnura elegans TaxID=197161 RepID=UPI001ED8A54F|nr:putative malate dehydrogenase 1B isoform X2 [Ischnura elegans]
MHYFVIAGIPGSAKLSTVLSVTKYLEKKYPYIIFKTIFVKHYSWKEWLNSITKKNGWNHFSLPIIWKEIPYRGGKRCLIGGCNGFMEYCREMFNVDFTFKTKNMKLRGYQMLIKDIEDTNELRLLNSNLRKVCIYGAGSVLVPLFLPWLLKTPGLATCDGLRVGLYDEEISKKNFLKNLVKEFDCITPQESSTIFFTSYIVNNMLQAAEDCDLLILIIPQIDKNNVCWSESVSYAARAGLCLSKQLRENIRVILVSESGETPICLCAAAFNQAASPIAPQNVVAVTAEIGIHMRSMLADSLEVSVNQIKEVPVWGFLGISHLLDLPLDLIHDMHSSESELLQNFQSDPMFWKDFLFSKLWPLFEKRQEDNKGSSTTEKIQLVHCGSINGHDSQMVFS